MLQQKDLDSIKKFLTERDVNSEVVARTMSYLDTINKSKDGKDGTFGMKTMDLAKLIVKYISIGAPIDGVNSVLTGFNKVFITWNGYKNKVLAVYPESQFDVQLVRDGDTFSVAKESGSVIYSHTLSDPFSSNVGIKGAYCVIKNMRGEFLETLGKDDFEKMKSSAMMKATWDKWESEFWLKSVIKRACKRHFNDILVDIEVIDNQDYDAEASSDETKQAIIDANKESDDSPTPNKAK